MRTCKYCKRPIDRCAATVDSVTPFGQVGIVYPSMHADEAAGLRKVSIDTPRFVPEQGEGRRGRTTRRAYSGDSAARCKVEPDVV